MADCAQVTRTGTAAARAWLAGLVAVGLAGCDLADGPAPPAAATFVDVADATGISFTHITGISGEFLLPEIVGAGGAFVDVDADGDLDVYLVQGGGRVDQPPSGKANELYLNELIPTGQLRFREATEAAGVGHAGYGMGVATGDIDNDGDIDLYITNAGPNVLYRNLGDGRFVDATAEAGVDDPRWSASATFADIDGDGFLDLFVTNYVAGAVAGNKPCTNTAGMRDYCSPTAYAGTSDSLFRNLGNGRFEDISEAGGIASGRAAGLGVIAADFDGDGRRDVFVANDQSANFLWRNLGALRFVDVGLASGTAYNGNGMAEASMGVTVGDYDGDGDEDLFMTHLGSQTNTLYANDGNGSFADVTDRVGLGSPSLVFTGFGSRWFDYDSDGRLDLFVANGAVIMEPSRIGESDFPYEQRNQLFRNDTQRFVEVRDPGLESLGVSRGAAFGDVDNDGDVDILVTNGNGKAVLLQNRLAPPQAWIGLALIGRAPRDAQGARVALLVDGSPSAWRRAETAGSFLSASDPRVILTAAGIDPPYHIGVVWPDGTRERWRGVTPATYSTLRQGTGVPWPP